MLCLFQTSAAQPSTMWVVVRPTLTFESARLRPPPTSGATLYHLELTANDGTMGSAPVRVFDRTRRVLRRLSLALLGQPVFAAAERWTRHASRAGPYACGPLWTAVSAIENAAADLSARALGVPLHELLGGCARRRLTVAASIVAEPCEIDRLIARVDRVLTLGVQAVVVRAPHAEWSVACQLLAALRDAFGQDLRLRLALERSLTRDAYQACMASIKSLTLEYIEDRAIDAYPNGIPRCTRVAVREWDGIADALRSPAYAVVNLSVLGWGGVPGIERMGATCRVLQREVMLSCDATMGAELPLSTHVALALPAATRGVTIPIGLDDTTITRLCQGTLATDDAPGIPNARGTVSAPETWGA
jgi:L-alanine-DL-glutamate epimerase-like enolase superfamily enzyme